MSTTIAERTITLARRNETLADAAKDAAKKTEAAAKDAVQKTEGAAKDAVKKGEYATKN